MTRQTHSCAPLAAAFCREEGVAGLTPEMLSLIAIRVEESLADPRDAPLREIKDQLGAALRDGLAKAPGEVIDAIRDPKGGDPHRLAYLLGQMGMAQSVAAHGSERRVGEEFANTLAKEGYAPYAAALLNGPLTNGELAKIVSERLETVSRKLNKLREIGAADFRRDGQLVHNFLTPAGQAVAQSNALRDAPLPRPKAVLGTYLNEALGKLDPHWSKAQNFSTDGAFSEIDA